ncbi:MAG: hypothetical protein COA58_02565 [Bacteroidetes bacterium]|nr:MAG: hypothetical protein COA58_02565 [Bacteroidota bacterium]
MKLSHLQKALTSMDEVNFITPNGEFIPRHYHLTEIGLSTKTFIDCGGKRHQDQKVVLQLWTSVDYHHRLKANKFLNIINTSLPLFEGQDLDIEVEYQAETVGKFALEFDGNNFKLLSTKTDCLASELCGIDAIQTKVKKSLSDLGKAVEGCCTPGGGCC